MALATAGDYKTDRGIFGTDFDTRIAAAVSLAERTVREYCGRDLSDGFESATRTEVYDGSGTDVLRLREWPVDSITSVKFLTGVSSGAAVYGDTLDASGYYTGERGELIRFGGNTRLWGDSLLNGSPTISSVWAEGKRNIQVVYVAGFSTIPETVKEAVYTLVDVYFRDAGRNTMTANQNNLGIEARVAALPAEVAARFGSLLAEWTRVYQ